MFTVPLLMPLVLLQLNPNLGIDLLSQLLSVIGL
jgi:hypothetical protein